VCVLVQAAADQPAGGAPDAQVAGAAAAEGESSQGKQLPEELAGSTAAAADAVAAAEGNGGEGPTPMSVDEQAPSSSSQQQEDQEQQEQPGSRPQDAAGPSAGHQLVRIPFRHSYTASAQQQQQLVQPGECAGDQVCSSRLRSCVQAHVAAICAMWRQLCLENGKPVCQSATYRCHLSHHHLET
jgi:hypothetical protein